MMYPIILCVLAGLSTAVGALLVVMQKKRITDSKIALFQGFAAGVMLTISVFDLLPESFIGYYSFMNSEDALKSVFSLFILGWIIGSLFIKLVVPTKSDENLVNRLTLITILVMALHNIPEGMLTMFVSSSDINMGMRVSFAVALHNFPEGISIAAPILYLTGSKRKAFNRSLLVGIIEPVAGIFLYLLLKDIVNEGFINGLMPIIAGIMCQASIIELIPNGMKISRNTHIIYGIILGVFIMSIGILAF